MASSWVQTSRVHYGSHGSAENPFRCSIATHHQVGIGARSHVPQRTASRTVRHSVYEHAYMIVLRYDYCVYDRTDMSLIDVFFCLSLVFLPDVFDAPAQGALRQRACHTALLDYQRDDETPDGKVRRVIIVIYCSCSTSLLKPTNELGSLLRATYGAPCRLGETVKITEHKGLNVRKLYNNLK